LFRYITVEKLIAFSLLDARGFTQQCNFSKDKQIDMLWGCSRSMILIKMNDELQAVTSAIHYHMFNDRMPCINTDIKIPLDLWSFSFCMRA